MVMIKLLLLLLVFSD